MERPGWPILTIRIGSSRSAPTAPPTPCRRRSGGRPKSFPRTNPSGGRKVFQAWFEALLATEPEGAAVLRAPNGVLVDLWEIFHARPLYDAGRIEVPTLVIRGSADGDSTQEDAFSLFEQLGSEDKQYMVIGNATHFLSLEKRAPMLIRQVQAFLED
jgi:pimeloyl-ACP methyl ester carboxylesterase